MQLLQCLLATLCAHSVLTFPRLCLLVVCGTSLKCKQDFRATYSSALSCMDTGQYAMKTQVVVTQPGAVYLTTGAAVQLHCSHLSQDNVCLGGAHKHRPSEVKVCFQLVDRFTLNIILSS